MFFLKQYLRIGLQLTFQYHEDAMKLQVITIYVSVWYWKGILYQSSTVNKMDPGEYLTSTCFSQGSFCIYVSVL